jgi:hypothetical protein
VTGNREVLGLIEIFIEILKFLRYTTLMNT